jgi:hypothetical protein
MREQDEMPTTIPAVMLAYAENAQTVAVRAVRARSGWTSSSLAAYGVATVVFITLTGILPDVAGALAYVGSWVVYGVIATWFARREQVSWRGFDRLSGRSFAAWFVLQGAGCAIGFNLFPGVAAYWVPVAMAVSAPFFVGAWRAAHR